MRLSQVLGFSALASTLLFTGCSSFQTTASSSLAQGAAIQGRVHGGRQPIVGAHIYLMAANTSGYGGASVSLLDGIATGQTDSIGAYVLTDAQGGFSISGDYSCTASQQVYLLAVGGDAGAGNNSASSLMAVLGECPSGSTNFAGTVPFISVNEVTTVAGAYALSGFMTDMLHVSSSGTALANVGVANAFLTAANLANVATGSANATTPAGNGTAPQAKLNTLANILASCINSDGTVSSGPTPTNCYTLFANATSDGTSNGTQPTETVTAAVNMAHWPGINVANLYALAPAIAPFQPTVSSMNNMSLALVYTGGGIYIPGSIAVDGEGNIWVTNTPTQQNGVVVAGNSLSKFAAGTGAALSPDAVGYTGGGLNYPNSIAIDLSNNVWMEDSSTIIENTPLAPDGHLSEFASNGTAISSTGYSLNAVIEPGIAPLMIDGSGNVYAGVPYGNSIYKVAGSSGTVTQLTEPSADAPFGNWVEIVSGAISPSGDIWLGVDSAPGVAEIDFTGTQIFPANGIYSGLTTGLMGPSAMAVDHSGYVWAAYSGNLQGIAKFSNAGVLASPPVAYGNSYAFGGNSTISAGGLAIDGDGHVFGADWVFSEIVEIDNNGGSTHGSITFTDGSLFLPYPPQVHVPFSELTNLVIDGSGNIWVGNNLGSTLTEFVGGAAPVVTPIAAGVANNMLGTRP